MLSRSKKSKQLSFQTEQKLLEVKNWKSWNIEKLQGVWDQWEKKRKGEEKEKLAKLTIKCTEKFHCTKSKWLMLWVCSLSLVRQSMSHYGSTPLLLASQKRHLNVVMYLLHNNVIPPEGFDDLLHSFVQEAHCLLSMHMDSTRQSQTMCFSVFPVACKICFVLFATCARSRWFHFSWDVIDDRARQ